MSLKNLFRPGALALSLALLASTSVSLAAMDELYSESVWKFNAGEEFSGASGNLDVSSDALTLSYDFSDGGKYVSADVRYELTPADKELRFKVNADRPLRIAVRFIDSTGQTFQHTKPYISANQTQQYRFDLEKIAEVKSWGGSKDGKVHYPVKVLRICVNAPSYEYARNGSVTFTDVEINR
ncbi:hypothetical protein [Coraliomargarita parva]|uniref:hypothetical protein n=1 Tax=Coraliomargarita parva TaxID=3014050 RepID=UPI0022B3880F|nr:hypothetical protein [Coraliomargarita parva]